MNNETQNNNLSDFKDYLVKSGYSNHVIPMYIRKVKGFLEYNDTYLELSMDYEELKRSISEYLATVPLTSQKAMIQAALHTY